MKKPRGQSKSNNDEEPPKRRPMTASYRRDKSTEKIVEKRGESAERKSGALAFKKKIADEDSDDHGKPVSKESENEKSQTEEESGEEEGREVEGGEEEEVEGEGGEDEDDENEGDEEARSEQSGEGCDEDNDEGSYEESDEESDEEDFQDKGDEDDFLLGMDDDEVNYELYNNGTDHVANHLLKNEDRRPLRCKQYTSKMWSWELSRELPATQNIIKKSVLYRLYKGSYRTANRVLVSAFVERWHPETTSFHMPFGEVTITLDDVEQLLELPIIGKPMAQTKWEKEVGSLPEWISRLIGIPIKTVSTELARCKGSSLRTAWIIENLSREKNSRCNAQSDQIARGFFLVLLGCTLFQDKSGDKVKVKYLYFLQDLNNLDKWAWAAGTLAYLYRMFSKASIYETTGVCGYLTLLEAWIYEHCPEQQPGKPKAITHEGIKTQKWDPSFQMAPEAAIKYLKYVRGELDSMTKNSFVWTPYRKRREDPHEVTWFYGCLVLDNIVEPYHPNRVVRRFGRVQDKPRCHISTNRSSRKKVRGYIAKFDQRAKDFEEYNFHLIPENVRGQRAKKKGQCTDEYDEWYKSTSIVQLNHELPPSVFASVGYEEGRLMRKAFDMAEGCLKKGMKATKQELYDALKGVVDTMKEGGGVGTGDMETDEASSSGAKRSKNVELTMKNKSKATVAVGKRKPNDAIETVKKKSKVPVETVKKMTKAKDAAKRGKGKVPTNDKGKGFIVDKENRKSKKK